MSFKVNPNRMELIRLKKRYNISLRGHKLLQDKLDKLISDFHKLTDEYKKTKKVFMESWQKLYTSYVFLRINTSFKEREEICKEVLPLEVSFQYKYLLNLKIPQVSYPDYSRMRYSPKKFPICWDVFVKNRDEFWKEFIKIINIYLAIKMCSEEILKTRRRVNALEYVLLPTLSASICNIESKLEELEREFITHLLRIKDILS